MNISAILKSIDNSVLTEDTATAIAEAFEQAVNEKVSSQVGLEVEKALNEQDVDHATKLKSLLEAIDTDHTNKLKQVVESVSQNHAGKLQKVVNYYRNAINEKAETFSAKIVSEMSNYLDLYLDKIVPREQLAEAVANVSARQQLEQIKKIVSFDPSSLNEDFKKIVIQGKSKIDALQAKLNESYKENIELNEDLKTAQASLLIEQKTKGMSSSKKEFIAKILNDKTPEYINENFNYVVNMFEREERSVANDLMSEASKTAVSKDAKVPKAPEIIKESAQSAETPVNLYVEGLKSFSKK
jgi:hypothetical protein